MEGVLAALDKDKYPVPDPYPYEEARRLFRGSLLTIDHAGPDSPPRWLTSKLFIFCHETNSGDKRGHLLP